MHGDLWPGNVLWGADDRAWLVDPAAHGGHRETDLAQLALFGGAPHLDRILAAYQEAWPLADGWRDRVPLHQLHLLLVHTALFGAAYRDAVVAGRPSGAAALAVGRGLRSTGERRPGRPTGRPRRPVRPGRHRPAGVADRPVQPALHLLHAGGGAGLAARAELLTDDEIVRLVRIAVERLGVTEVRFTGGEPLMRPGLVGIVAAVAALTPRPRIVADHQRHRAGPARRGAARRPAWTG